MDITTLAAWGEFIGGIAVVVSLIYLASQIRQNSRLLLTSSMSTTNQQPSTQNILRVQEPEVARIFWEGITDRDLLSTDDRGRPRTIRSSFGGPVSYVQTTVPVRAAVRLIRDLDAAPECDTVLDLGGSGLGCRVVPRSLYILATRHV